MFIFFNDTATTEIYTLSLHDALPISDRPTGSGRTGPAGPAHDPVPRRCRPRTRRSAADPWGLERRRERLPRNPRGSRSEEHTSELQSRPHLVCRLLLEKKTTEVYLIL